MRHLLSMKLAIATIGLIALAPSQVQAQGNSTSAPFSQIAVNLCTGNPILISGTLHTVTHVTFDENGGVHAKVHFNLQGVKGTDLVTGDKYVGTGATNQKQNITSGAGNFSLVSITNLIGKGKASNAILTQNVHFTLNANGVVTANVNTLSLSCH